MSGHIRGKGRVHVLRRPLNELLPSIDVAFIENDVGKLRLIQVDDTPSVVGDQLQQRRETGVQINKSGWTLYARNEWNSPFLDFGFILGFDGHAVLPCMARRVEIKAPKITSGKVTPFKSHNTYKCLNISSSS